MQDKEIVDFIVQSRNKGASDQEIRSSLLGAGWESMAVDNAFATLAAIPPVERRATADPAVHSGQIKQHIVVPDQASPGTDAAHPAAPGGFVSPEVPHSTLPEMVGATSGGRSKKKIIALSVTGFLVVVLLTAGSLAFAAFGLGKTIFGYNAPDKLWADMIDKSTVELADRNVKVSYVDKGDFTFIPSKAAEAFGEPLPPSEASEYDSKYTFTLKDINASYGAGGYYDLRDADHPRLDMKFAAGAGNNGHDYNSSVDFKFTDANAFLKFDFNQEVTNLIARLDPGAAEGISSYKNKWLKLKGDGEPYKEVKKSLHDFIAGTPDESYLSAEEVKKQKEIDDKLKNILKQNRPFDIKSFKGITRVNGVWVSHYSMTMNKQKIRTIFVDSVKQLVTEEEYNKEKDSREYFEKILDIYLSKWEVKNFEVWVGISDHKTYKSTFVTNMPSVIGIANMVKGEAENGNIKKMIELATGPTSEARVGAKDAKRLSDIRQLASAVELYYNDFGGYPEAENGKPKGVTPSYIYEVPSAPEPPSGKCTAFYNTYWYTPVGEGKIVQSPTGGTVKVYPDYKYSFCLGGQTGGYKEGNHYLTSAGIGDLNDCPSTRKCYEDVAQESAGAPASPVSTKTPEEQIKDYILDLTQKIPFTAEFTVDSEAKSYNVERKIDEPADALDIEEEINKLEGQQIQNQS